MNELFYVNVQCGMTMSASNIAVMEMKALKMMYTVSVYIFLRVSMFAVNFSYRNLTSTCQ